MEGNILQFDLKTIEPRATGIAIIDSQHKALTELVREICSIKNPFDTHKGRGLINHFYESQVVHDAVEHVMFRAVSSRGGKYPHSTAHLSGHMNFLSPLERVVSNIKRDIADWKDMKRLSLVLNIFVLQHTDGSDTEYVQWYGRSGISPAEVNELITEVLRPGDDRINIQIS